MAMSLEEINKKLEKVWKDLDDAIEKRDIKKVQNIIKSAQQYNEKAEGETNEKIITELEEKIEQIAQDIHPDSGIKVDERITLAKIKGEIQKAKDPFQKIEKVVEKLSKEFTNQEDLKNYKEQQKEENTIKIDVIRENSQELNKSMVDIEMRYLEPIKNNQKSIEIMNQILKEIDVLKNVSKSTDAEIIKAENSRIKSMLSELESKGVDISKTDGFEADFNKLYEVNNIIKTLKDNNETLVEEFTQDTKISPKLIGQYQLDQIKNDKELVKKYEEMKKTRQKYISKIRTLEAENKQIDETIQMLDQEKALKNIAYNEDGTQKNRAVIARTVLNDPNYGDEIEDSVDNKFFYRRGLFKRTRAKIDYYRNVEKKGRVKAIWNAFTHKTKNVKKLARGYMASEKGIELSNYGNVRMQERRDIFVKTMKKEVSKEISKNPTLTESDIKDNVVKRAYESALGEDREH